MFNYFQIELILTWC